jgi:hypothetical protein
MKVTVHDMEIELEDLDPDEIATDVVVLMRTVRTDDDGRLWDAITIGSTPQTTGMVKLGMLDVAAKISGGTWVRRGDDE